MIKTVISTFVIIYLLIAILIGIRLKNVSAFYTFELEEKEVEALDYQAKQIQKLMWTIEDRYGNNINNYDEDVYRFYSRLKNRKESILKEIEKIKESIEKKKEELKNEIEE